MVKILFVCMGNICRSPTAEGVFRQKVIDAGLQDRNAADLHAICPPGQEHKIKLFLEFGSQSDVTEVPDPYYGGSTGFERVLDLIEDAADGLLNEIR